MGSIMIDDQEAIQSLKNAEQKARDSTTTFDKLANAGKKIGTLALAGATVAGTALVGMAAKGAKSADDLAGAVNGVEAATGLADDATTGFKATMLDIYNNNFGDSFEDIGSSMAEVTKQTGLTGDALKETTEYALMMRDTFGMEVVDSVRSAEMMMDTFGTTSEEAYNLLAQGAQNGLDKNGDLLDTVNEYSMYFEGMGINADEMFNMLANGAEDGTFSVDKLGDAMKEFSIRSIDGSEGTADAFKSLGLNAGEMTTDLANGGEDANNAIFRMADALFAMEDPVEQNKAGVALFGSQWEDLGADGVNALLNVNGEMDSTKQSMDEINNTKYDTVGEAIAGLGRNFETGILIPIGEKVLPILQVLVDKFNENMPAIKSAVESAFDSVGGVFDTATTAFSNFVNSPLIQSSVNIFKDLADNATSLGESPAWGTIRTAIEGMGTALLEIDLQSMIDDVQAFTDKWLPLIAGFGGAALTVGLVTGAITLFNLALGIGATVASAASLAYTAVGVALLSINWPLVLIGLAIGAVIATIVLLWQNLDKVKAKMSELKDKFFADWEEFKSIIASGVMFIISKLTELKDKFASDWEEFKSIIGGVFKTIKDAAIADVTELKDGIVNITKTLKDAATADFEDLKTKGLAAFNKLKTAAINDSNQLKNGANNIFKTLKSAAIGDFNELKNGAVNKFNELKSASISKFNEMKNSVVNKAQEIKSGTVNKFGELRSGVTGTISGVVSSVRSKFGEVYNAMVSPVNRAKNAVSSAVNAMKGFFNFNWKLPKISMPSFSVSGSKNPIDWIKDGVPKLAVNWNAKGGIFSSPTLFPTAGGYQGVGEAGAEAVLPLNDRTYGGIGQGIADSLRGMFSEQPQMVQDNRPIVIQIDGKNIITAIREPLDALNGRTVKNIGRGLA